MRYLSVWLAKNVWHILKTLPWVDYRPCERICRLERDGADAGRSKWPFINIQNITSIQAALTSTKPRECTTYGQEVGDRTHGRGVRQGRTESRDLGQQFSSRRMVLHPRKIVPDRSNSRKKLSLPSTNRVHNVPNLIIAYSHSNRKDQRRQPSTERCTKS